VSVTGTPEAGDGTTVMLGLQNEREWVSFCTRVLEQPELASDPRFTANFKRVEARDALRGSSSRPFHPSAVRRSWSGWSARRLRTHASTPCRTCGRIRN
jgi:crotonobetainyl-CoA:carnitine CoA-transferase CaiB-like acyl-CoA transferase